MPIVSVNLPANPYAVRIEPGLLRDLGRQTREVAPHERALLAVDERIGATHGAVAADSLAAAGFSVTRHPLTSDEKHKTLDVVRGMYAAMLSAKLERRSPVIALGGGVIGDVAGFAAATYLRGVPLIHAPTSLLSMVDASIGGKTGVNLPLPSGGVGKNLAGAFWQPRAVLADPEVLRTLPPRELRCGLAECVKHALIADPALLEFLESRSQATLALDMSALTALITASAQVKAAIVAEDERETGRRALLNLGHTFAHAVEPIAALDLHHGEAVAIGLCAAMHVSQARGWITNDEAARVERLLIALGLPTKLARRVDIDQLMDAMSYDKKVVGGTLRLVLPRGLGAVEIVNDVPREAVVEAWRSVTAG
jgi:3-dehydroquinate synthase